jgi:hypothetical protein
MHAVTLFTTSSYGVSREPATFFSQVHTFQTRLSHTFPCFLLANCLVFAGTCCRCQAADTQNSVAEEDGLNTGRTWTGGGKRRQHYSVTTVALSKLNKSSFPIPKNTLHDLS